MSGAPNLNSFSQGYALCSPKGTLLGHSYRPTESEAIGTYFTNPESRDEYWEAAKAEGWTVQFVYARVFTPIFFATPVIAAMEAAEKAGAA